MLPKVQVSNNSNTHIHVWLLSCNKCIITPHLHGVDNLWFIRLQGQFPILRTRSCPDLYPLIRPPRRSLALGRGRILIPGFIRSPPTLAVCEVAHSLPLGGADRVFAFTEDETRRHFSYLSGTFRELKDFTLRLLSSKFLYIKIMLTYRNFIHVK